MNQIYRAGVKAESRSSLHFSLRVFKLGPDQYGIFGASADTNIRE